METTINIVKSRRRTISIQINEDLSVTVRAPKYATKWEIEKVLREKEPWIQKHIERMKIEQEKSEALEIQPLSGEELKGLAKKALQIIPERVEYFSKLVGVSYGHITIRNQKTRWGSCSSKGNLNFNCLLMLTPPEVLDYVVVHELCHRKEMNHSKAFWDEVAKILPDYKSQVKWLKEQGSLIIRRIS